MNVALSQLPGRRILVTGASGFIGSHLCARLRGCGAELHAISRKARADGGSGLRWWQADLADTAAVQRIVAEIRPDVVFHLASEVAGARDVELVIPMLRSNLLSTVNLLSAMAEHGGGRFVLAGSMEEPRAEDRSPVPCSPYAASKWATTGYARMFHSLYGLETVALRIFMVYGPGQGDTRKLIPYTILSLLRGEAPRLTSGTRPIDWVYVDDVVDALIGAAVAGGVAGQSFDVGSATSVTIREIVEQLVEIVDPPIAPIFGAVADRPLETVRIANIDETRASLRWAPQTSLRAGLAQTVNWYRERFAPGAAPQAGR